MHASKHIFQKNTCSIEIVLHALNMITILGLLVNIRGGGGDMVALYDQLMSTHNITKQLCALKVQPRDA